MKRLLVAALLALVLSPGMLALAQDQSIHDWFQSLRMPAPVGPYHAGTPCCSESDCHVHLVLPDPQNNLWVEDDDGQLLAVPRELTITDQGNPLFQAVVCIAMLDGKRQVLCYVPGVSGG